VNLSGASFGGAGTLPVTVTVGVLVALGGVSALVLGGVAISAGGLLGEGGLWGLSRAPAVVATRSKLKSCQENKRRMLSTPEQTSSVLRQYY
jgi:hypothetical protein